MPLYTIKVGSIWKAGKQHGIGATVELTEADREKIDPKHTDLASLEELKADVEKAKLEAASVEKKASQLEAEHKAAQQQQAAQPSPKKAGGK
jgi:hypothetical protein